VIVLSGQKFNRPLGENESKNQECYRPSTAVGRQDETKPLKRSDVRNTIERKKETWGLIEGESMGGETPETATRGEGYQNGNSWKIQILKERESLE